MWEKNVFNFDLCPGITMGTVTAQNYTHTIVGNPNAVDPSQNTLFVRNQTAITISNIGETGLFVFQIKM